jgi:hypothetical protein
MVGHGRNDAGHMGRVLLDCQKAAGIRSSCDKGQKTGKVPVGLVASLPPSQPTQVQDHERSWPFHAEKRDHKQKCRERLIECFWKEREAEDGELRGTEACGV